MISFLQNFVFQRIGQRVTLFGVLRNTGWLLADKIFRMGVGIFVGVWIARYLGPEQFGLWNYAIAFSALFGAFSTLGLDRIVIHELVDLPEQQNEIMGSAFLLKLVGGFLALGLSVFAISLVRGNEPLVMYLLLLSATGYIFQSINVIDFYFQSKLSSKYTVFASNAAFLLISVVKVILLLTESPLIAFAFAGLAEIVLSSAFIVVAYISNHQDIRSWKYSRSVVSRLLKSSWPLMISHLAIMIYMRIDQIMIGMILTDIDVGLFSAAVKLSELWYFVPLSIASSVFPVVQEIKKRNNDLFNRKMQSFFDFSVAIALFVALPLTFFSGWLMEIVYGEEYKIAGQVLAIHIWCGIFVSLEIASGQWFVINRLQLLICYRSLFGLFLNVSLNLVLIPKFGMLGAATSTLLSQSGVAYFFDATNKKTRELFIMKTKSLFLLSFFLRTRNHFKL